MVCLCVSACAFVCMCACVCVSQEGGERPRPLVISRSGLIRAAMRRGPEIDSNLPIS